MVCGFPLTTLRARAELLYSFFGVVRHKTSPPLWLVLQYQLVVSAQWMLSGENRNSPLKYFCVWTPLFLLNCFRFPALLFSPISQHDDFCSTICHNFRFFPRPEEKVCPRFLCLNLQMPKTFTLQALPACQIQSGKNFCGEVRIEVQDQKGHIQDALFLKFSWIYFNYFKMRNLTFTQKCT